MRSANRSAWRSIGERRHRCTLQKATPTTDALGGRSEAFTPYGTAEFAAVASDAVVKSESEAFLTYTVEFPYRPDTVDYYRAGTTQRVVFADLELTLKVLTVDNPEQRNRTLVLSCGQVFE